MSMMTIIVPAAAPGKPRMTRRDRWAKRPCVMAYRAWADLLRLKAGKIPPAEKTSHITIEAWYEMPGSWSAKKRDKTQGARKRSAPDGDNVVKGICDALWNPDAALGDMTIRRRWGDRDETIIKIELE